MISLNVSEYIILGGWNESNWISNVIVSTNEMGKFRTVVENEAANHLAFDSVGN